MQNKHYCNRRLRKIEACECGIASLETLLSQIFVYVHRLSLSKLGSTVHIKVGLADALQVFVLVLEDQTLRHVSVLCVWVCREQLNVAVICFFYVPEMGQAWKDNDVA